MISMHTLFEMRAFNSRQVGVNRRLAKTMKGRTFRGFFSKKARIEARQQLVNNVKRSSSALKARKITRNKREGKNSGIVIKNKQGISTHATRKQKNTALDVGANKLASKLPGFKPSNSVVRKKESKIVDKRGLVKKLIGTYKGHKRASQPTAEALEATAAKRRSEEAAKKNAKAEKKQSKIAAKLAKSAAKKEAKATNKAGSETVE